MNVTERFYARLGSEHGEALFDAFPDAHFFVKDTQGRYMRVNRTLLVAYGFSKPEEVLGKRDHDFIPRHLADHYVKDDQLVFAGQSIWSRVELVLRHRGCPDWFVTSKIPLRSRDGSIIGLAGVARHLREAAATLAPYSRLAKTLEFIRQHYSEPISTSQLARLCGMSARQLQQEFQRVFQVTPTEYLRQFRLGEAVERLVTTNATILAIALETGFSDQSHLAREFRRSFGVSPGAYRRKYYQG